MRKIRKMTWVLIGYSALIIAWLVSYGSEANCSQQAGQFQNAKQSGCEAGTTIGVFVILVIGALGFMVLSAIWFMTRPKVER